MTIPKTSVMPLAAFRTALKSTDLSKIFRQCLMFGDSAHLSHEQYCDLRDEVSEAYRVRPCDVVMVGSGKLGFSISPRKNFKEFNSESDLDIAIVSPSLFDSVWTSIAALIDEAHLWEHRDYFLKRHFFNGWIMPHRLPHDVANLTFPNEWFDFFQKITNSGRYGEYPIKGGLYKSWDFLERYQMHSLRKCRDLA